MAASRHFHSRDAGRLLKDEATQRKKKFTTPRNKAWSGPLVNCVHFPPSPQRREQDDECPSTFILAAFRLLSGASLMPIRKPRDAHCLTKLSAELHLKKFLSHFCSNRQTLLFSLIILLTYVECQQSLHILRADGRKAKRDKLAKEQHCVETGSRTFNQMKKKNRQQHLMQTGWNTCNQIESKSVISTKTGWGNL